MVAARNTHTGRERVSRGDLADDGGVTAPWRGQPAAYPPRPITG